MKTAPKNSGKANFGRAILLVAFALLLGSSGCQKDDALLPSSNSSVSNNSSESARTLPAVGVSDASSEQGILTASTLFTVIKIVHQAANSHMPAYSVIVRSDGMVIYDGVENVGVKGRVAFKMTDITFPVLHEVFDQYSFYYIQPDFRVYADMPVVFTTYQPTATAAAKTIYDDYHSNPQKLVLIRTTVENLLGIDKYVQSLSTSPVQDPSF